MLLACANVAPRGVFVTATGVTTSGLTVSLSRDRFHKTSFSAENFSEKLLSSEKQQIYINQSKYFVQQSWILRYFITNLNVTMVFIVHKFSAETVS
jgi:hypothetical protein